MTKVYELLDSEDKWTKEYYARNSNNEPVSPLSPEACKWCIAGALDKCYSHHHKRNSICDKLYGYPHNILNIEVICTWNDTSTYEEIIKVVKELDI